MGATLEQVETQRAELQDATAALEQLQHDVAYFQAPAGEEAFSAFSALLEQLSAQRDLVEVARVKLDYILSLYESQWSCFQLLLPWFTALGDSIPTSFLTLILGS